MLSCVMSLATKGGKLGLQERGLGIDLKFQRGSLEKEAGIGQELNGVVPSNEIGGSSQLLLSGHMSKEVGLTSNVSSGPNNQAESVEGKTTLLR
ncbi:hypothetical protein V6N13_009317 [Hibiscus sabdariffa]|uniref:Uncharacterized protein n=1 Tax=Hibiscus sabdariffa TaxID=183260 RepID=A0ABR2PNN3_9ROSI